MQQTSRLKGQFFLASLLLSVLLVSLASNDAVQAGNVQDPLPTLISNDDEPVMTSKERDPATKVPLAAPKEEQAVEPQSSKSTPDVVQTSNKSNTSSAADELSSKPSNDSEYSPTSEEKITAKKDVNTETPIESTSKATKELTSQSNGQQSPASVEESTSVNSVKDINTLLENKNDAENDVVASSTLPAATTLTISSSSDPKTSLTIDLDAPVDTNNPVDDRLHYSLSTNQERPVSSDEFGAKPIEPITAKSFEDEKKDTTENKSADSKTTVAETSVAPSSPPPPREASTTDGPVASTTSDAPKVDLTTSESSSTSQAESALDGKSSVAMDDKTKAIVIESPAKSDSISGKRTSDSEKESEPVKPPASAPEDPPVPVSTTSTSTTTTTTVAPRTSGTDADRPASEPRRQTTEGTRQTTTEKSVTPVASDNPVSSVALDAALGAAAGSALGSVLTSKKTKEDAKPAIQPNSTANSNSVVGTSTGLVSKTTTRIPARKSTTDRWNRWSPAPPATSSSTTLTPPYRRRPILPSIRRRFRPHTRFSPFPWGGADSYSPFGSYPDYEDASSPGSGRPSTSGTKSSKRRGGQPSTTTVSSTSSSSTTTTVEPASKFPASSTTSSGQPKKPSRWDNEEAQEETEQPHPPTFSTRRRAPGSEGGRRHHSHNHNHHHNRDFDNDSTHRRRHHQSPPHFGSGFDLFNNQDPLSPSTSSSFGRPSGFGLFNSAPSGSGLGSSTGSGFDLLNPFSWLDEVTRPRPSRPESRPPLGSSSGPSTIGSAGRPPGHRPIPVEGEFNSGINPGGINNEPRPQHHHHREHDHDHHNYGHGYGQGGRRPVSVGNGRDDYDDYHDHYGHDCHHDHDHDHDHDHHHEHRPHRPHRPHREPFGDRPPIGGDYDTYPPNSNGGFGGSRPRPNRPYHNNRRNQGSEGSTSSSIGNGPSAESESSSSVEEYSFGSPSSSRPSSSERINGSHKPEGASPMAGPRRVSSVFSPFDSLFGSLDDDLFGGLRSSFIDSPYKAAAETNVATSDAVISSPKIMMPMSVLGVNPSAIGSRNIKPASAPSAKFDKENLKEFEGKSSADGMKAEDHGSTLNKEKNDASSNIGHVHYSEHEGSDKLNDGQKPSLVRLLRLFVF